MTDAQWLSPGEQETWRVFLCVVSLMMEVLNQGIENEKDTSFNEYGVLVHLSELPGHTIHMSSLANRFVHSRSRLTHMMHRLEDTGLVRREPCADDRRGVNCILAEKGFEYSVSAVPSYVNSVRRVLVDKLDREDMLELRYLSNILANVASEAKPVKFADSQADSGVPVTSRELVGSEESAGSTGAGGPRSSDRSADSEGPASSGESADASDSRAS